jgi:hypothetical protein
MHLVPGKFDSIIVYLDIVCTGRQSDMKCRNAKSTMYLYKYSTAKPLRGSQN